MRTALIIIICKLCRFLGRLLGKGSSLPGKIALKLDPNILKKIKMPQYIVAVTGSNGKTSTVEMIAHVLRQSGRKIAYNREGSNQIEGVTTFILNDCTLSGRVKSDLILLESDERFARFTFKYFTPTHYVITNLYRDQLTRNGHPEWIYRLLKKSITSDSTQLVLNADDPLVSCFGLGRENTVYYGAGRIDGDVEENTSIYNDGAYCPNCKEPLKYDYYHYNHIGYYHCESCGLHRERAAYEITAADLHEGYVTINGRYRIDLAFKSLYHCYNVLAAFSICNILGVPEDEICRTLGSYILKSGRVVTFTAGENSGVLLTSKHENSVSYDQAIRLVTQEKKDCTVVVIVDAISRKYFTSETSWLWDIDFELLRADNVKRVILAGEYCYDLMSRFSYCGIDKDRIEIIRDIGEAVQAIKAPDAGYIYVITCFSDKDKFLSKVKA